MSQVSIQNNHHYVNTIGGQKFRENAPFCGCVCGWITVAAALVYKCGGWTICGGELLLILFVKPIFEVVGGVAGKLVGPIGFRTAKSKNKHKYSRHAVEYLEICMCLQYFLV